MTMSSFLPRSLASLTFKTPRHSTQSAARVAMAALVLCAIPACTSDDADGPAPTSPPPSTPPPPAWPLTGLPAKNGVAGRPALVAKIDNTGSAEPQVGLSQADLVIEELVEGGMTRLAAFYHSRLPKAVGPVRSVRTTDIGLTSPTGGALVASGGAGRVLDQMESADVTVLREGNSEAFERDDDRPVPYNVMANLRQAASEAADLPAPAEPYLPWGTQQQPDGDAVEEVTAEFSPAQTTRWTWDGSAWQREPELAKDAFVPAAVLVLRVRTRDAGYQDPSGNPVPETILTGKGKATLLVDGTAIEGRWSKADAASPFELESANGNAMEMPQGKTWIELVPMSGAVSLE